ncbi:hypothetical protein CKO28_15675 [Rhodovibrio sodomensis]|uniref:O-antigen ligase-related domain-containing protein n=2 Tax=Rhodovibrio sodomensis TaxID=1088 RepID=A0ABS1DGT5_9PROT|nr:hypothetical protein [Rhodovibrio sodomensis]
MSSALAAFRRASEPERLARYLGYAIPFTIVGLFLFDKAIIRSILYIFCLVPIAVYVYQVRWTPVRASLYWWVIVLMCGWWLLSIAWSQNMSLESAYDAARLALIVALFFTGAIAVARQGYLRVESALTGMLTLALMLGLAILIWIAVTGDMFDTGYRLRGFGFADHPVQAGIMYGFAAVVALMRLFDAKGAAWRASYAAALIVCSVVVALTDSRGPMIGMIFAACVFAVARDRRLLLPIAGGFAALLLGAHTAGLIDLDNWVARGSSLRFEIWSHVLSRSAENPFLGLGAAAVLDALGHNSAHNIVLGTLFYQGLVGVGLLLILGGRAAYDAFATAHAGTVAPLVMLAFASPVLLVDNQSFIINLNRDWLILYLPILMLCRPSDVVR